MGCKTVIALALAGGLGGCATLDRGATDRVYVVSEPAGARATFSTGGACTTPCAVTVSRRDTFTVAIGKTGYQPQTVTVATRINAAGAGDFGENIATGGAGAVVDLTTGAVLEHTPNPIEVTLKALASPSIRPGGRGGVS